MWVLTLSTLVLLAVLAYSDIKTRSVDPRLCLGFAAGTALIHLAAGDLSAGEIIGAVILGMVFIGLSHLMRGAIGAGDGFAVLAAGCGTGFSFELASVMYGLVLSAAAALILIVVKHAGRKATLPFLPYLLAGHALAWFASAVVNA